MSDVFKIWILFKICQIYDYSHDPRDSADRISLRLFEETIRVHSRNFIGETKNKYGRSWKRIVIIWQRGRGVEMRYRSISDEPIIDPLITSGWIHY